MYGYDTLRLGFSQVSGFDAAPGWDGERIVSSGPTGYRVRFAHRPPFTFEHVKAWSDDGRDFDEFRVECSLPKVLRGCNVHAVMGDELSDALDLVEEASSDFVGVALRMRLGVIRRIDATYDIDAGSAAVVKASLARLSKHRIRRRAPVVGESGSVTWVRKTGSVSLQAYDKGAESGKSEADGVIRVEAKAHGQGALKKATGADMTWTGEELRRSGAGLAGSVLGEFPGVVLRAMEGAKAVSFLQAVEQLKKMGKRSDVAVRLAGYAALANEFGWEVIGISRQAEWQARKELKAAGLLDRVEVPKCL